MANGTYNSVELIDTLIADLNSLPKYLFAGQNIAFCDQLAKMGQKLVLLKNGVQSDIDNKNEIIEQLKKHINDLGEKVEDIPAEKFVGMVKNGEIVKACE